MHYSHSDDVTLAHANGGTVRDEGDQKKIYKYHNKSRGHDEWLVAASWPPQPEINTFSQMPRAKKHWHNKNKNLPKIWT